MSKPLSEQTLYERLDPQFTDMNRAQSTISLVLEKLWKLDYENPDIDLQDEVQVVIDTLIMLNRAVENIAENVEKIALDFKRRPPEPRKDNAP